MRQMDINELRSIHRALTHELNKLNPRVRCIGIAEGIRPLRPSERALVSTYYALEAALSEVRELGASLRRMEALTGQPCTLSLEL